VSDLARWRDRLFALGWGLLLVGASGFFLLFLRSIRLRMAHSNTELAYWLWGGIVVALLSLTFALFGRGWKRWLLGSAA
jgi:hypothetical protein